MPFNNYFMLILSLFLLSTSCSKSIKRPDQNELLVMTHDSFNVSKKIVEQFEKENSVTVKFLKSGNAAVALTQAILSKNNPLADVFVGVDNTFLSKALKADIFDPYNSPFLKNIPDQLKLDKSFRLLPFDYGDVCLNYDVKWFQKSHLPPPSSLDDLVDPKYLGLTVVENPATSSPGLSFLLTTISYFGTEKYLDYWLKLKKNQVLIVNGWKDAYWSHFSGAKKNGKRPIVVSYASSPVAEVHFAKHKSTQAPTKAIISSGTVFRQIEFVGILKKSKNLLMAKKFIDFMLDRPFQEDIPLQMFMFPASVVAKLPKVFIKHAQISKDPVNLPFEEISKFRDQWVTKWAETVLH